MLEVLVSYFTFFSILIGGSVSGKCINFTSAIETSQFPTYTCGRVVNYNFYIPESVSLSKLNEIATSLLNDTTLSILPGECQSSLLNLVCSNVFLKCPNHIDLQSAHKIGWNRYIYSDLQSQLLKIFKAGLMSEMFISLPFQRPCKSICDHVNTKCLGLLPLVGQIIDCDATFDYSFGALNPQYEAIKSNQSLELGYPYQYDHSNNESVCNPMLPMSSIQVASTKESYLHANDPNGACFGFIEDIFVPPGPAVSPLLAPMQPPYVVQTVIETALLASFASIPVWLSQSCRMAFKRYFCNSFMLSPQPQSLLEVLQKSGITPSQLRFLGSIGVNIPEVMTYSFSLPSYPHRSVCEDYQFKCADFIALAGSSQPALVPQCAGVVKGVAQYPTTNQTIVQLPLTIDGQSLNLAFVTSPHSAAVTRPEILLQDTTRCPTGFVEPDAPRDPALVWIPGTGCSFSCQSPLFTPKEWKLFDILSATVAWISLPLVLATLIVLFGTREVDKSYLLTAFLCLSGLLNLNFAYMSAIPWEERHCRNNGVGYQSGDGDTLCSAQSFISVYSVLGTAMVILVFTLDVLLTSVEFSLSTVLKRAIYFPMVFGIPAIVLIVMRSYGTFGYSAGSPFCFIVDSEYMENADAKLFYIPLLVIMSCTMLLLLACIYISKYRLSSLKESTRSYPYPYKLSLLFILIFVLVEVLLTSYRFVYYRDFDSVYLSVQSWTSCVFMSYDGDDASWQRKCGEYPSGRFHPMYLTVISLCDVGQTLIVVMVWGPKLFLMYFYPRNGSEGSSHLSDPMNKYLLPLKKPNPSLPSGSTQKILPVTRDSVVVIPVRGQENRETLEFEELKQDTEPVGKGGGNQCPPLKSNNWMNTDAKV